MLQNSLAGELAEYQKLQFPCASVLSVVYKKLFWNHGIDRKARNICLRYVHNLWIHQNKTKFDFPYLIKNNTLCGS